MIAASTPAATALLSAKDAARYLGISARTLWAISAPRGNLPVVRIGARCLYDLVDLTRYIQAQKKGGAV